MNGAFEEQVRQRAYEIWTMEGRHDGRAHQHWLAAERDVQAGATTKPAVAAEPKAKVARAKTSVKPKAAKASTGATKVRAAARKQPSLGGAPA